MAQKPSPLVLLIKSVTRDVLQTFNFGQKFKVITLFQQLSVIIVTAFQYVHLMNGYLV